MRRAFFSWFLLMLAMTAGAVDVPDVIVDEDGPLWVAAEVAVTPDGRLRVAELGRFGESVEDKVRVVAEGARGSAASDECRTYFGGAVCTHFKPTGSLDDLTNHAGEIVAGDVVALRQGFLGGSPGSLLRIQATYLKGSEARETYLFYPYAAIVTADATLCARPIGAFVPPQRGDRLLIFSMGEAVPPRDGRRIFQVRTDRELVHEHAGGVVLPEALASYAGEPHELDVVLDAVVRLLAQ